MKKINLSPTLIVGTGLVGASIGMALTARGVRVHVTDAVPSHAIVAASLGAGTTEPVDPARVRLVVVAVPPAALADVVAEALTTYPRATVTDVGSVKGTVLAKLRARDGLDLARYVGSHPMAGSQHAGPLTARADLFEERTWVVTPHDTASAHTVLDVGELVRLCGAREVSLGPAHHDEAVAEVSHVPQLLSSLMGGVLNDVPPEHLRLAGQGVRDVTRVAGSDPGLWRQIIAANRSAVAHLLHEVRDELDSLLAVLDGPDDEVPDGLTAFLQWGQDGVRQLPGKHGAAPGNLAHVVIEIPDTPGALARLFADIGEVGFNVEDLAIEHDTQREVGFLSVQVARPKAAALEASMRERGWTVRH